MACILYFDTVLRESSIPSVDSAVLIISSESGFSLSSACTMRESSIFILSADMLSPCADCTPGDIRFFTGSSEAPNSIYLSFIPRLIVDTLRPSFSPSSDIVTGYSAAPLIK